MSQLVNIWPDGGRGTGFGTHPSQSPVDAVYSGNLAAMYTDGLRSSGARRA